MSRERVFRFKHFNVIHERSAMKVGTDGVLLGAWCRVGGVRRVLDVGTGCGVIAMMIAQRSSASAVDAIDIDSLSVEEASCNFAVSPWAERLKAMEIDFSDLGSELTGAYDLIVSNPPFFVEDVVSPDARRSSARHTGSLSIPILLGNANRLLNAEGTLAIITPTTIEALVRREALISGLGVTRLTRVVPVEGAKPKRLLWEMTKANETIMNEDTLIIKMSNGNFSEKYIELTHDFYLKL